MFDKELSCGGITRNVDQPAPNDTKQNQFTPLPPSITSLHHFTLLW